MFALIVYALPFLLVPLLLVTSIQVINHLRDAFTSPYYRLRSGALRSGMNWLMISVGLLLGLLWALNLRSSMAAPDLATLFTFSSTPSAQGLAAPGTTPLPDGATKDPFGVPPTITPTLPTPTTSPTPFVVPVESVITPLPGASMSITAIASQIGATFLPLDAGTQFAPGIQRIYIFFDYTSMSGGVSWARALVLEGKPVRVESETWKYNDSGKNAYYYFEATSGWPAGNYQVQFYIGAQMIAQAAFSLQ